MWLKANSFKQDILGVGWGYLRTVICLALKSVFSAVHEYISSLIGRWISVYIYLTANNLKKPRDPEGVLGYLKTGICHTLKLFFSTKHER